MANIKLSILLEIGFKGLNLLFKCEIWLLLITDTLLLKNHVLCYNTSAFNLENIAFIIITFRLIMKKLESIDINKA